MLEEIVATVARKTGLSTEQAQVAVQEVVAFLKQRLPAPLAGQLDMLTAGTSPSAGGTGLAGGAESLLGNMFGNKG